MRIDFTSPVRTKEYALLREMPSMPAISETVHVSRGRAASMPSIIHIPFPVTFPVWLPFRRPPKEISPGQPGTFPIPSIPFPISLIPSSNTTTRNSYLVPAVDLPSNDVPRVRTYESDANPIPD
jgi:hypothetical protein